MRLYTYFRSSAAYRVRIALNLKGVAYEAVPVNLLKGEQRQEGYRAVNPQQRVPSLDIGGATLIQSPAILEYLDEVYPEPPLLPVGAANRARVRAVASLIACDIHPLNNLRVLKHLVGPLAQPQEAKNEWIAHWISEGFAALEALASERAGRFLFGDAPSLADICLVPQMYNARRFEVPVDHYPSLVRADAEANRLGAFAAAHPDRVAPAA